MKMTNEASTSNPSVIVNVGEAYRYPSLIAPNFVTMKLSGKDTYNVWETQILCLLKSHHMYGFIDGQFPSPAGNGKGKEEDMDAWIASDSLVKCWILGSLSDGVAKKVVNRLKPVHKKTDFTAKDLWDELQRSYGPSETKLTTRQAESAINVNPVSEEEIRKLLEKSIQTKSLHKRVLEGETNVAILLEDYNSFNPWDKITNNGNTILHVAVGSSTKNYELLENLLDMTPEEKTLLDVVNSDGSTLLHVAAIGGNIEAVNMLVKKNPELLKVKDKEGHIPLALSVSNMHIKTSHRLFEHMKANGYRDSKELGKMFAFSGQSDDSGQSDEDIKTSECPLEHMKEKEYDALFTGKSGEELVVLAISCQDFNLAKMIIDDYPDAILSDSDAVLTALAQNFPSELHFWETRRDFMKEVEIRIQPYKPRLKRVAEYFNGRFWSLLLAMLLLFFIKGFYAIVTAFVQFLKAVVHPFIKDTSQVYKDAKSLLPDVCHKIRVLAKKNSSKKNSSTYHQYYNNSIFEATKRNSSTFIRRIMKSFPDAIWSANEDGHNFIQYSVINRSEKFYNLLYEMSEHKNIYKTIKDSSGNNLLHLAARLAPTNKLNLISGAALQIQRELQ